MQGVPVLNAALRVEALGFEWAGADDERRAEGVLVTPWFLSLVRLPGVRRRQGTVGRKRIHAFGRESFEFIEGELGEGGYFESCSLFSPMHDFENPMQARDTAYAVLAELRAPVTSDGDRDSGAKVPAPSRRSFLLRPSRGAA